MIDEQSITKGSVFSLCCEEQYYKKLKYVVNEANFRLELRRQ